MRRFDRKVIFVLASLFAVIHAGLGRGDDPPRAAGPVDRRLPWVTENAGAPGVVFRTFDSMAAAGPVSF